MKTDMDDNEQRRRQRKILIADDDPAILRLLTDRCQKIGFQVETAMNGVQLLVKARHNHPDILICDVNMPALDGLSVCVSLLDPGRKPLEVIVMTGASEAETAERCDSLGTFFARKGPDFWKSIKEALIEIYPDLAGRMEELPAPPPIAVVPQRSRVLVVDDDPDFKKFLASRLAKYGIDTLYAPDATHGFRLASKENPSVIISDNYMPDGDAQFLLHRLRAAPATTGIPVIVISARTLSDIDEHNLRRDISGWPGACHVMRKSYETDELFEALRKFCSFAKPAPPPRPYTETEGW
jgi:CheY-like chemotaxis protein